MNFKDLLNRVTDAIQRHNDPQQPAYPQNQLVGFVRELFNQHDGAQSPRPASEDPLGDPADLSSGARPASQDPQGDPADQQSERRVRPASEDPYGDPADL